jgi:peptidoglycan/xylan/chitin deacetylase (PgdA/CDA1 family)
MSKARKFLRHIVRNPLLAEMARMRNERPIISFTFDDFPRSAVLNGARILEKHGARGTFYTAGSFCGQIVDGITQYNAEDLTALFRQGHEIGCHTFRHRRVSSLSKGMLTEEVELNAAFIARHLPGAVMRSFAYPYGDVSFAGTFQLERTFAACRSTAFGINRGVADLGRLYAVRLYNDVIDHKKISTLVQEAVAPQSWLIFYTHDVDDEPSKYGCTPALFEHAVKTAASSGAEILPVVDALKAIRSNEFVK